MRGGVGYVAALGAETNGLKVGDAVMPYCVPECGVCAYCTSGRGNFCVEMARAFNPARDTPFSRNGRKLFNFSGIGSFSEYCLVRDDQILRVRQDARPDLCCCIACAVTTGVGSVLRTAEMQPGGSAVVFGAGGVGLNAVQGAKIAGAKRIIVVDTNTSKEDVARRFGATDFINPKEQPVVETIIAMTGIGADYSFDCAGYPETLKAAVQCLNKGWGKAVSVGSSGTDVAVPLTFFDLAGRTLTRTLMGSARREHVAEYVEWFIEGKLKLDDLVSHRIRLDDINTGVAMMNRGEAVRVVIEYS
jgi:S-(hydroxymethyl)glutathione dehydrogenase/alcohol dehydrogenase